MLTRFLGATEPVQVWCHSHAGVQWVATARGLCDGPRWIGGEH
jgi:hypothetical protein